MANTLTYYSKVDLFHKKFCKIGPRRKTEKLIVFTTKTNFGLVDDDPERSTIN